MAFWGCHPDHDVPENHLSSHDFGAPCVPLSKERLRALELALTAVFPAASPANRPADTLGVSASLTTESPEPAGTVLPDVSGRQIDLFSRLNGSRA